MSGRRVVAGSAWRVTIGLVASLAAVACGSGDRRSASVTTARETGALAQGDSSVPATPVPPMLDPTTVVLAPGVNPPASAPAARVVHDEKGMLAPCTATVNGVAGATYAPTLLVFEPTGPLRWALCPAEPRSYSLGGVVDGVVLATSHSTVDAIVAHDVRTGELRWWRPSAGDEQVVVDARGGAWLVQGRRRSRLDPVTGAVDLASMSNDVVEVRDGPSGLVVTLERGASPGATVRARDAATDAERWSTQLPGGRDLAVEGDIVVAAGDGTIGVDLATGTPRWQVAAAVPLAAEGTRVEDGSSLTRAGAVFVESASGGVDAVAVEDGRTLWSSPQGLWVTQRQMQGAPGDLVVLESGDGGRFEVRDVRTGDVRWAGPGSVLAAGPSVLVVAAAHPGLFDIQGGTHLGDLATACIVDATCSLSEGYIERVATSDDAVVIAVNDFGSP